MIVRSLLFATLALPLLASPTPAAAEDRAPVLEWLDDQADHFARHPELVGESGTGWKQYARLQHFFEGRVKPDGTPPTIEELRALRADHDARLHAAARRSGNQYFELGPTNIGGRVLDIEFDPNVPGRVYAATAGGGLARSSDGGTTWTMMTDYGPSLSTSCITVNPTDADKLVMATGGTPFTVGIGLGIFYSLNGGATWQPSDLVDTTPWIGFNRLLVTPGGAVHLAFSDQGIYRSTDDGATWTQVMTSGIWWDALIVGPMIYAVMGDDGLGGGGIYRSPDVGLTWVRYGTGQPAAASVGKSRLAYSQGTLFALIGDLVNDSTLGLWTSVNGGSAWVQSLTGPETGTNYRGTLGVGTQIRSGFNLALAVDPNDADNIFTGGQYGLMSTDGGLTWTAQEQVSAADVDTPHVDYHAAVWRNNGTLWVGTDGGIYSTDDAGVTWTPRNTGIGALLFNSVFAAQTDLSVMFGGSQDNRHSGRTSGTLWEYGGGLRGDGARGAIDPTNPLNIYVDTQSGNHYRSTDGGANFVQSNSGFGDNTSGEFVNPLAMDPNAPMTLYAATNAGSCACGDGLWRTTDGMQSWGQVDTVRPEVIGVSKFNSNNIWTVRWDNGDLRISIDGFATANEFPLPFTPGGYATDLETMPNNGGACLIAYDGYLTGGLHVVFVSQFGNNIVDATGNLPDVPANAVAIDPQNPTYWFVGTDLGVYVTTDLGANWEPYGMGLPNAVVTDLEIHAADRKLIVGTYGRGAWITDLPTGTSSPPAFAQPSNLMLDPPSPNPTSHQTLLRFAAKHAGDARLDIYDVAGRRVDSLGSFPGDGVVRLIAWNPQDAAAGVYFAVLQAGGERMTRKIVVAR